MLVWMKRAGCECIQLGVESGSVATLKLLGKTITPHQVEVAVQQIRRAGIGLSVFLISDIPGETEQDLLATIDLVKKIRPDDGYVSPLAYYPGTRLFEDAVTSGLVDGALFTRHDNVALFASNASGRAAGRLLRQLTRHRNQGSADSFQRQKELLGYCYATNVLAGEWYRQSGNAVAAEREFREIIKQEAENPWGWYLLAEMFHEVGDGRSATEYYRNVCELVPEHRQSRDALDKFGAKKKRGRRDPAE
jgi:tetratricopeptide (TPR) repeat protein